jgi:hypothetical protein
MILTDRQTMLIQDGLALPFAYPTKALKSSIAL